MTSKWGSVLVKNHLADNLSHIRLRRLESSLVKRGYRLKAFKMLRSAMLIFSERFRLNPVVFVNRMLLSLEPRFDVRKVVKSGRAIPVLFPIRPNRRIFLSVKFLVEAVKMRQRRNRCSTVLALVSEFSSFHLRRRYSRSVVQRKNFLTRSRGLGRTIWDVKRF